MNVDAHDRSEQRRLAKLFPSDSLSSSFPSPLRRPNPVRQGITPTDLRRKVHQLGPSASLVRVGKNHYVATICRQRFEGQIRDVNAQLQPLFIRFNIS